MFTARLEQRGPLDPTDETYTYDPADDNIVSVLSDACRELDATHRVRFVAGGFGDDAWPVDVTTDLAVVIEQVPLVIAALREGEPTLVDFYEQGLERNVLVRVDGEEVNLTCVAGGKWKPSVANERTTRAALLSTLSMLLDDFVRMVAQRTPQLRRHEWFVRWLEAAGSP